MSFWKGYPVPAMRHEAWHGDRVLRCFHPRPASVWAMFAAAVARTPDAEAVVAGARRLSFAQCDASAAQLAGGLAARGIGRGDRVVMFIDNRPEFITVLLALQRLGAIAVPVGVREQRPGLAYIVRQCGATAIVVDASLADRLPDASEAPELRVRIRVGMAPGCTVLAELQTGDHEPPPVAELSEAEVAVVLYTSGTTGHPKGAMLTHRNIVHSVLHYQACMGLNPGDRAALAVPA
ncbi:MAG: AMP-binding protein, partial [Rubrivivax sp.]